MNRNSVINYKKRVRVVSRANHPVYLSYNGENLVLSPRAGTATNRPIIVDPERLGAVPKCVILI